MWIVILKTQPYLWDLSNRSSLSEVFKYFFTAIRFSREELNNFSAAPVSEWTAAEFFDQTLPYLIIKDVCFTVG